MEPSDSLPSHTEYVQRGSPRHYSTRRVDTVQRLVDRMPINPKIAVFESTQERFEAPLRPDMWSSHSVAGGPGSSVQMPPGP
ncbi:uncharacterized protein C2845_PM18G06300 [Panicum miliaceum]|uniref:Uncharacterized protein n=1 Tax=Panicum miliaceum TaxID=4540 RepID=A0A3L6PGQ9_PANMI|nr:uncharacterized protein C2845_PM18G06300 [Panicum miliaceum]